MDYWRYTIDSNGTARPSTGQYLTDHLTDCALRFLRAPRREPFFLHLAYYTPHRPLQPDQARLARYADREDLTPGQRVVYAMIESMDHGIEQILSVLRETGQEDNTILVFTSDNGPDSHSCHGLSPVRPNCGLRGGKYSAHDGGIRVPLMIRWPAGMLAGRDNHDLFHFVDFLPTLAAACGVTIPTDLALDGANRLPVWQDDATNCDPVRFWQWNRHHPYPNCNAAMRDGDWKLVYPALDGYQAMTKANVEMIQAKPFETTRPKELSLGPLAPPLLFNLRDDPSETNDLAATHPQRVDRMTTALDAWFQDVMGDFGRALDEQFPDS
jgi:arylsulfatase A